jgi:hypothetical protein
VAISARRSRIADHIEIVDHRRNRRGAGLPELVELLARQHAVSLIPSHNWLDLLIVLSLERKADSQKTSLR